MSFIYFDIIFNTMRKVKDPTKVAIALALTSFVVVTYIMIFLVAFLVRRGG